MEEKDNLRQEADVSVLDFLIVILKHKRLVWGITLSAVVLTAAISFLIPPVYRAETKILPPQEGNSAMAAQFLMQLGAPGLVGGALGVKTSNDLYLGLLQSRAVLDRVIERFNLMKVYDVKYHEDARRKLQDALKLRDDKKSGIITIGVEDRMPERSAEMANAFVEELKRLKEGLAVGEASQRRLFFEEQMKAVKADLITAEESMQSFQQRTAAIELKEQAKAVIESIAQLRAKAAAKEVELKVMKTYAASQNPDLQRTEEELRGLREQLGSLEARDSQRAGDPLMPTGKMPAAVTDYARKLRDLKYYETLYDLLSKQYEVAKIDEARDAAVIQVVDKAAMPEKRVGPKRMLMIAIAAITALFIALLSAFFVEYVEKTLKNTGNRERVEKLRKYMPFRTAGREKNEG
jgi:tyrosine-protein kinase Etk/Wzc